MDLITVKEQEWKAAEQFFQNNATAVKFKLRGHEKEQSRNTAAHSFIRVGGAIFAIATKSYSDNGLNLLGEGTYGKVRMVQSKKGDNFAVKIEGRGIRGETDAETKIMKILDYLKGEAARDLGSTKRFKKKITTQKLYTVTKLIEGVELEKEIYLDPNSDAKKRLQPGEKLSIALNACKAIQVLHTHNIIHGDIKPANFMANRQGEEILIASIDYGCSLILPPSATQITLKLVRGSPLYMAPEIGSGIYSYSSDIYALGIMLSTDLSLYDSSKKIDVIGRLVQRMCHESTNVRPKLDELISHLTLAKAIENIKNADEQFALNTITTLFKQIKPSNKIKQMEPADQNYFANIEFAYYVNITLALMKEKNNKNPVLIAYLNNLKSRYEFANKWNKAIENVNEKNAATALSTIDTLLKQMEPANQNYANIALELMKENKDENPVLIAYLNTLKSRYEVGNKWDEVSSQPTLAQAINNVNEQHTPITLSTIDTRQKLDTVTKLIEGVKLEKEIYVDPPSYAKKTLTPGEKLSIALNACKAIQVLHTRNIIHADIKPANFMANRKGEEILIEPIDSKFSLIVTPPATKINLNGASGTAGYIAPEIKKLGIYSYSSDIYALGIMLGLDLSLYHSSKHIDVIKKLVGRMCDQEPNSRPKLDEVISTLTLAKAIENIKNADEQSAPNTIKTLLEPMEPAYQNYYANIALELMKEKQKEHPVLIAYLNNLKSRYEFANKWNDAISTLTLAKVIDNVNEQNAPTALSTIDTLLKDIKPANPNYYANIALELITEQKNQNSVLITYLNDLKSRYEFANTWTKACLKQEYIITNRHRRLNPFLYLFKKRDIISPARDEQLGLLSGAIDALQSSPDTKSTLNVFYTIAYIKAQLKAECNMGSRLNHMLTKIEKELTHTIKNNSVNAEDMCPSGELG